MAAAFAEVAIAREANAEKAIRSGEILIVALLQVWGILCDNLRKSFGTSV
jgi:hypothetical protein